MKRKWFKLDNAAKIFPPTSTKKDPKVFRFACELKEEVDKDTLQQAILNTLKLFPTFQVVLKHGLFWYYLETTSKTPIVKLENKPLCSPIYSKSVKRLLFRVSYYQKRVNLEIYHVLSDGLGALEFLKTLVIEYCNLYYGTNVTFEFDASFYEQAMDSFEKYYAFQTPIKKEKHTVYHFKGEKLKDYRFSVIEGYVSTNQLLKLSKKYHTTLTVFLISIYIKAILENMSLKEKKKTIIIDVPVNLRKYFKSVTARNFFSVIKVPYKSEKEDLKDIISYVDEYLKKELSKENLFKRMNQFATIEHNFFIRLIPLFLKTIILKIVGIFTERSMTTSVSNLGNISIPNELEPYIERFDVFVSTSKMQICICSYLDNLTISFTSVYENKDIIKDFFRLLQKEGIMIQIVASKEEE